MQRLMVSLVGMLATFGGGRPSRKSAQRKWAPRSRAAWKTVWASVLMVGVLGCGESVQDQMMARAQAKAARNRIEKEEEAKAEAAAAAEAALAAAAAPATPPAESPSSAPVTPTNADKASPNSVSPAVSGPVTVVTTEPPIETQIDRGGRLLAFAKEDGDIGLFDLSGQKMLPTIDSASFQPSKFAMHPGGQSLFLGNDAGRVRIATLGRSDGIDAFERRRRQRRGAAESSFAHVNPITALVPVGYAGGFATGDRRGNVRVWKPARAPEVWSDVTGKVAGLQIYGGGKFLFATVNDGERGNVVYWPMEDGRLKVATPKTYVTLDGTATAMVQSSRGGGLAVGDSNGHARVWASQNGRTVQSALRLAESPITAMALLDDGGAIVLGDSAGNLRRFNLPVVPPRSIDLPSSNTTLLALTQDGSRAVVAVGGSDVRIVRLRDGQTTARLDLSTGESGNPTVNAVTAVVGQTGTSPWIAVGTNRSSVAFFDGVSGRPIGTTRVGTAAKPDDAVTLKRLGNGDELAFWTSGGFFGRLMPPTFSASLTNAGGQGGGVRVASDPAGDLALAVASGTRLTRVYETSTGRIVSSTSLAGLDGEITAMLIRGGVCLFGTDAGSLWIWQSELPRSRARRLSQSPSGHRIVDVAVVDDASVLAVDQSGQVLSWDLTAAADGPVETQIRFHFQESFERVSIGRWIAFQSGSSVVAIDASGKTVWQATVQGETITALASSALNPRIAVGDAAGKLWINEREQFGDPVAIAGQGSINAIDWTVDGTELLLAKGDQIACWDARVGQLVSLHPQTGGVDQLRSGGNSSCLWTDRGGEVKRRELARVVWQADDPVRIGDMVVGRDASWLAGTQTGEIWTIQPGDGSITATNPVADQPIARLITLADDRVVAQVRGRSELINVTNPAQPAPVPGILITAPTSTESGDAATGGGILAVSPSRDRLAVMNADGSVVVLNLVSGTPEPVTVGNGTKARGALFLNDSTLVVLSAEKSSLQIEPIDGNGRGLHANFQSIVDVVPIGEQSVVAVADGTRQITLMDVSGRADSGSPTRTLSTADVVVHRLFVNASASHLAAAATQPNRLGSGDSILIWKLGDLDQPPTRVDLPGRATCLHLSPDGSTLAVGTPENAVDVFDVATAEHLESIPVSGTPATIQAAPGDDQYLVGLARDGDGQVTLIERQLERHQPGDGKPVRRLAVVPNRYLVLGEKCSLRLVPWSTVDATAPSDSSPKSEIKLIDEVDDVTAMAVQTDGEMIAVAVVGESPRVDVWRLPDGLPWGRALEPSVSLPLANPADSLQFISKNQLLVGDRSGLIELWDLSTQKSVYQFVGHQSPIAAMTTAENGTQLISCSGDRSVRRWTLPASDLLASGEQIPQAKSLAETGLANLPEPTANSDDEISADEDVFADVREALLTGSGVQSEAEVFRLFEDDRRQTANVASKYDELRKIEQFAGMTRGNGGFSNAIAKLVGARRQFHEQRRSLTSLQRVSGGSTFADNQPNLLFNTKTDFNFTAGVQSVEPEITQGRFVYAAMSSGREPGALSVWDFGVSGVRTHAWNDLQLRVRDLFALPDDRAVLSLPDLRLFSRDGTSRRIADALRYTMSSDNPVYAGERLFATANRGQAGRELTMLQVFRGQDLMNQSAAPVASLSGFESEVTAMAFANSHRALVLSVRERSGYRLLMTDPVTLDVREFTLIDEQRLTTPWLLPPGEDESQDRGEQRGAPGPTTLAFSPDDKMLLVHSNLGASGQQQEDQGFDYSVFRIDWPETGLPDIASIRRTVGPVSRGTPYFDESLNRPVFFVSQTLTPDQRAETGRAYSSSTYIAFRAGDKIQVVNAIAGVPVRSVPLLSSGGVPRFAVTPDGQWMVTGDDRGAAQIANLETGKVVTLTPDGRPAHSGPIVGVAISPTNPLLGYPEYVVTVGEENRLKVWDILERIAK